MSSLRISLITVCYNAVKTIRATLESAMSQKGIELEYIVIDGGSTDGTVDIIREFHAEHPGFSWVSEKDRGMYDALNKGIGRATGDIVGILNADDAFEDEDTLAVIAEGFKDESIEAIYADIRFVRNGETVRYYSAAHWKRWMHNWGYMPPHPSVYIRREVFGRLSPYKLGYKISADFELMVRYFCKAKIKTCYLPRCVVKMTPGGLSTGGIKSMIKLNAENVRANRENGYFCCMAMMLPKYFYKVLGLIFKEGKRR